jgi:hypothetical protein
MDLPKFIDHRFQELRLETEGKMEFNAVKDSELKAVHALLNYYRTFLKFLFIPKILCHFFLVKLKLVKEPKPVLMILLKQQKDAEEAAKSIMEESNHLSPLRATEGSPDESGPAFPPASA